MTNKWDEVFIYTRYYRRTYLPVILLIPKFMHVTFEELESFQRDAMQ